MNLIFSRDRPAQLDLLLRSMERHLPPSETRIIWYGSDERYRRAYRQITLDTMQAPDNFNVALRAALEYCTDPAVTFFCDDDVMFNSPDVTPAEMLLSNDDILSVALSLGASNQMMPLPPGFPLWEWGSLDRHDFGFPCGVDGNTYRPGDVKILLGDTPIDNPTWLETMMLQRLGGEIATLRPLMTCPVEQCLVGNPINRVSPSSSVPYGRLHRCSPEEALDCFEDGWRIDLDALDFSDVYSVHHELRLHWV